MITPIGFNSREGQAEMSIPIPALPSLPVARLALLHASLHQIRHALALAGKTDIDLVEIAEQLRITCDLEKDLEDARMIDLLWYIEQLRPELLPMQALDLDIRVTRQILRIWAEQATDPTYAFNYTLAICLTLAAHQPELPVWYLHSLINTGKDAWLITALTLLAETLPREP